MFQKLENNVRIPLRGLNSEENLGLWNSERTTWSIDEMFWKCSYFRDFNLRARVWEKKVHFGIQELKDPASVFPKAGNNFPCG